ncbi:PIN domain-containing protein, partial [Rhizobium leguminosarum]|uniref:PIN domain-containing protein n=1 Tax=Rhizobium leguminosarum TaxID=384 RepID=UPI003F96F19F
QEAILNEEVAASTAHASVSHGFLTEWLRKLRYDHGDRILPVNDEIAVEWGRIAAIRPRGDIDGMIAATAIVHDLIVVTRNIG